MANVPDRSETQRAVASYVAIAAGLALLVAHAAGLLGAYAGITFVVLAFSALAATVVGVWCWKPRPRLPWILLAAAFAMFFMGGVLREAFGTLGDLTASRSLIPDLFTMPGYALLALGLLTMARGRRRGRDGNLDATLDATVAALAALTLAWVFLIIPTLSAEQVPLPVRLVLACYPPMSVFLVAIGARIAFSPGVDRAFAFRGILLAVLWLLVGDVVYMLVDLHLVAWPSQFIDVPYGLAYIAVTAAVLHPTMNRLSTPMPTGETAPQPARLAFVAVALCVPAFLLLLGTSGSTSDRVVLAAIVIGLTGTASWRMFRALRQHARSESRLAHQATHDALTGLANRPAIEEHLDTLLAEAARPGRVTGVALVSLDLDRFKLINDTLGHSLGDALLVAVAERLADNLRARDLVGRIDGDCFVIVVDGVADIPEALEVAERTRLGFATPFRVMESAIPISASVGVAFAPARVADEHTAPQQLTSSWPGAHHELHRHHPSSGRRGEDLLRDADTAMYRAKDAGGDTVELFDVSMRERVARRLQLEHELRHALEDGQLDVHLQPIVSLPGARITGFEALLRWRHPTIGPIAPDLFIPIAEDTGLIMEIGDWVIDESCRHLASIHASHPNAEDLWVAVNLSGRQLRDPALVDRVARALLRHRLPPSALLLELTESVIMNDMRNVSHLLGSLRDCGIRVAIDDFGTGYSSLAYLKQLPVDEVKIDREFVSDLGNEDSANASLIAAVVAIARSLGLSTVAEGVESAEQAARLHELGCDEAQGYFFARPMPVDQVGAVIARLGCASGPHLRVVDHADLA